MRKSRIRVSRARAGVEEQAGFDRRSGPLGLDPRSHLAAVLFTGTAALLISSPLATVLLQAVAALYLAANGRLRLALRLCAIFAALLALSYLPLPGLYGAALVGLSHMMPPYTAGCSLFTLSPSAVMCALSRWRLPQRALVGVCLGFRFATVVPEELRCIVRGIRMRGVFPRSLDALLHPALAYECFYTPLVMRCLRLSSELAASAELRGIEADGSRSSVYHVGFSWRDPACAIALAAVCATLAALGR